MRAVRLTPFVVVALASFACGKSAPPPAPPPTPTASQAAARVEGIARACAKIASCAHAHDPARERDPAACVDWWVGHVDASDPFGACVDRARGCGGIDACLRERGGNAGAAAYCRTHPGEATACDGARLITCADDDPAESTVTDCAAMSASCGETHGAGGLITRGCLSPTACPPGAPEARCDGDAIVTCRDGAIDRTACAPGVRCEAHRGESGAAIVECAAPGHQHCADAGKARCDGAKLVQCAPHGGLGEVKVTDCGALGMACDSSLAEPACALPGVRACSQAAARCDGDALTFCAAGRNVKISCSAIGFGACDPDGHGLYASCATAAVSP